MKCIKCKTVNINKANYCKNCAYHFSLGEQKAARRKTIIGKIELLEKTKSIVTLKTITGNIFFKMGSILIVFIIGLYFLITNGIDLKLLTSDNYIIQYNTEEKEYYLITDVNKISLNLYIPNRTEDILIEHYNSNDKVIEAKAYNVNDDIVLETKEKEYYVLTANYLQNKNDSLKFYVLKNS